MALIHHVHLPAGLNRCKSRPFDQLTDVVDAGIGGGINFDHIEGCARSDRAAQVASPAGFRRWPITVLTVQGARQNSRTGRFARTSRAAEQVSRRDPVAGQRLAEGGGNGFLANKLIKALRTVFVMQRLVVGTHAPRALRRGYSALEPGSLRG